MASLIKGYEYDIFISYRQKDNKHDGWVTEFVDNLKGELESTFKDEISVYFDINPNEGLLETHDVDASLKDKLKSFVFIPIISRTYCDPKSFAWDHEFKAFVEQASKDQIGLKVKLPNGNVTSRVLPVRIYDLDKSDIKLFESVLGGVLRSVDFIYKSTGVNRPLNALDNPDKNLNKTYYRDQINKVANSIKEIITALEQKIPQKKEAEISKEVFKPISVLKKDNRIKIIISTFIVLAFIVPGYFLILALTKPKEQLEKSIAVLPFRNDSPNDSTTYFMNGVMEEILNNLQKISGFSRVLSRNSVEQFRNNTTKSLPEIAKALGVNYIVEGSGQKFGNSYRLRVQLIAAKNERHLWGDSYGKEIRETKDIYGIQSEIAQSIATELKATITPEEKRIIEKTPTSNLTAYDFYQRGEDELAKYPWPDKPTPEGLKTAANLFHKALHYDSTFAQAYTGLAGVFWKKMDLTDINDYKSLNNYRDSMLILADIALSYNDKLENAYIIRGEYYKLKSNYNKAIDEIEKAIKYNPNDGFAYRLKASVYYNLDIVKPLENLQIAASLIHGPSLPSILYQMGSSYYCIGFPEKGNDICLEALKLQGDSAKYLDIADFAASNQGEFKKGIEYNENKFSRDSSDAQVLSNLGEYHLRLGNYKESLKYYKKFISVLKSKGQTNPPPDPFIGFAYLQNGYKKEAEYYLNPQKVSFKNSYKTYDPSSFEIYNLADIYASMGNKKKAFECLKMLKPSPWYILMTLTSIKNDPLFKSIRQEPEFQSIVKDMESKYQAEHEKVRKWLAEQGTLQR
jgi:TolB-like protein